MLSFFHIAWTASFAKFFGLLYLHFYRVHYDLILENEFFSEMILIFHVLILSNVK